MSAIFQVRTQARIFRGFRRKCSPRKKARAKARYIGKDTKNYYRKVRAH